MEEMVADQAGGNRRPAKVSRRRTGGRASESSEVATGDTPGAGGNRPAAADSNLHHGEEEQGLDAEDEAAGDKDKRYLDKKWQSMMVLSLLLMWAKARPLTHPPAWVSRAREIAGGEPHRLLQARLYVSLWALSFLQEVAIVVVLCLFKQKLVSAGRARAALRLFMGVALACSLAVLAVVVGGSGGDWGDAVAVLLTVAPGTVFVLRKLEELLAKVGRLFRG